MSNLIKLKSPISVNGESITELQMREPKVRDQLAADKLKGSDIEKELRMLASLCEVSPEVIEELSLADYQKLGGVYQGFLS